MQNPADLATPLDAPTPRGLVRARLAADGAEVAGEGEAPPQRFPTPDVRRALTTPPPVRFRRRTPMDEVEVPRTEVTEAHVRQAFTFGADEPDFHVMGVEDFGWAPRRKDHALLYGLDGTLKPAEPRAAEPLPRSSLVIWVAGVLGLLGGIALAAFSA